MRFRSTAWPGEIALCSSLFKWKSSDRLLERLLSFLNQQGLRLLETDLGPPARTEDFPLFVVSRPFLLAE